MAVVVTKHAEKRLRERMGLKKKSVQRAAEMAYEKGIKHAETNGNLNKWITSLYFNNKTANNIRIYNDKAWIFAGQNLITVLQIPASLKKSVKDVLNRRKNEEERHLNGQKVTNLFRLKEGQKIDPNTMEVYNE